VGAADVPPGVTPVMADGVAASRSSCPSASSSSGMWRISVPVAARGLPFGHRRPLHSTNLLEWLSQEFKKHTSKVSILPNEASLVRLYRSSLMEIDERRKAEERRLVNMERREK
jgi:transposase-like protein